jgi:glyoxylase-like metal-dependent hydrolase (beta-lactamase superfamily II)
MLIQHFHDERTGTISYVVSDEASRDAIAIDTVLDYESRAGRTYTESAEKVSAYLKDGGLNLLYVLDTHPHADHVSAQNWFKEHHGAKTGIGADIVRVQETWRVIYHLGDSLACDGSQFDVLLKDGDVLEVGSLHVEVLATDGHTPASLTFKIGDALFVGDSIFMPDYGTARCDFPGGSAATLYDSVQRLLSEPDETRIFTAHDYCPGGRELRFQSTVAEEKASNVHLQQAPTKEEFIKLRGMLENGKSLPMLLLPALQMNLRAGRPPEPESDGVAYLKIPLNRF